MFISELIEIKCTKANKEWLLDKNYPWVNKEKISINSCDLPARSNLEINYFCDYCLKKFARKMSEYTIGLESSPIKKDSCRNCFALKIKESNVLKYGVENISQLAEKSKKISESLKEPYENVKNALKLKGLLIQTSEKEYMRLRTGKHIEYICTYHQEKGIQKISVRKLNQGQGCKSCGYKNSSRKRLTNYQIVKTTFDEKGYILLESEESYYAKLGDGNKVKKLKYICPKHREIEQSMTYQQAKSESGCYFCGIDKNTGINNHNWQGGITPISRFLRQKVKVWKLDSLKKDGYRCTISGVKSKQLEVHHLVNFVDIVHETFRLLNLPLLYDLSDYSLDELQSIAETCLGLHYSYGLGATLTPEIHEEFHKRYGYFNNTVEQFEEFRQNYYIGIAAI